MLDIHFIRENRNQVVRAIKDKGVGLDLDAFLALDEKRRALQQQVDAYRAERNTVSDAVAHEKDEQKRNELIARMQEKKEEGKTLEQELSQLEAQFAEQMLQVPNVYSEDTPVGPDESANREIDRWGEPPEFDFEPKTHIELGEALGVLDLERGAKVSGFRGYFLKNELAILHQALLWYVFQRMAEKGFTPMVPPTMVKEFALTGSGHFPGERQEIYEVQEHHEKEKETKFLAGTSEPSLLAFRAEEILNESELPLRYVGLSPCYRREVGGYGKDVKGLYRVHEFMKVEQVVICRNDLAESLAFFEEIKEHALELLRDLELPHRVVQIATGDMGSGKYKMYDIETWMPSRGAYGETHSNSHLTDWQARRLNLRYRTESGDVVHPYTMNNTAVASPRMLIAIMENFQQKDGSIRVPEALQQICGFDVIAGK